jgi:DNA-binding NarL/FixJ family response regulator
MRVLLVEDHAIVRAGLRRLLGDQAGWTIAEAADGREALAALRTAPADLVVLDLNLPGLGGFELLRRLLSEQPGVRIVVLSMHAEARYAAQAMQSGAHGYVSKNAAPEEVLRALQMVAQGGRYIEAGIAQDLALRSLAGQSPQNLLTERDLEIVRQLGAGRSLTEIADALGLGYKTIANTCTQIKAKLGVTRTADLVRLSAELGA